MKKTLRAVFLLLAIACAVGGCLMLLLPGAVCKAEGTLRDYKLWEVCFGCRGEEPKATFLSFLPVCLLGGVIAGLIVEMVAVFAKPKERKRKLTTPFATVLLIIVFVAAGVLFLYELSFVYPIIPPDLKMDEKEYVKLYREYMKNNYELGSGAIWAAVLCFVGAVMTLLSKIMQYVVQE